MSLSRSTHCVSRSPEIPPGSPAIPGSVVEPKTFHLRVQSGRDQDRKKRNLEIEPVPYISIPLARGWQPEGKEWESQGQGSARVLLWEVDQVSLQQPCSS